MHDDIIGFSRARGRAGCDHTPAAGHDLVRHVASIPALSASVEAGMAGYT